jgi:hypothetical protein
VDHNDTPAFRDFAFRWLDPITALCTANDQHGRLIFFTIKVDGHPRQRCRPFVEEFYVAGQQRHIDAIFTRGGDQSLLCEGESNDVVWSARGLAARFLKWEVGSACDGIPLQRAT